jgi:FMN phosphatase YigB (HAD superfamily)
MKKAVFFDGDGTLWYPRQTLRRELPYLVYTDPTIHDPIAEFIATPNTASTLKILGAQGVRRVLLSTSPLNEAEGIRHRQQIMRHVAIHDLVDDVHVAPDYPSGKSEMLVSLLGKFGLKPEEALMVGDNCEWDFLAAQAVDVDAALIGSDYERGRAEQLKINPIIEDISGVLGLIGLHHVRDESVPTEPFN